MFLQYFQIIRFLVRDVKKEVPRGLLGRLFGDFLVALVLFWGLIGVSLGALGTYLGSIWVSLGALGVHLGSIGVFLEPFGCVLGALGFRLDVLRSLCMRFACFS